MADMSQTNEILAWDAGHAFHKAANEGKIPSNYYNDNEAAQTAALEMFEKIIVPQEQIIEELRLDSLLGDVGIESKQATERWLLGEVQSWLKNSRHGSATKIPEGMIVMVVDLDGLKQINGEDEQGEKRGHDMGDAALMMVGNALSLTCRVDDHLGRPGGDELIAIMFVDKNRVEEMMDGENGVEQRLRNNVSEGRKELIKEYSDRWPKDKPDRKPGEVSIGWEYLTVEQAIQIYEKYVKDGSKRKSNFTGYIMRGADKKLFRDKSRKRN